MVTILRTNDQGVSRTYLYLRPTCCHYQHIVGVVIIEDNPSPLKGWEELYYLRDNIIGMGLRDYKWERRP